MIIKQRQTKEQRQAWYSSQAWKAIARSGGKASADKLTPEERSQRAKRAVDAREAKRAKAREENNGK